MPMLQCLPVTGQFLPVTAVDTTMRLAALRQQMQAWNLSAYIITDTDAHMVRTTSVPFHPLLLPDLDLLVSKHKPQPRG